jgi:anti-sigma regulatory factor (Ser/Thr protein kinase)
MTLAVHDLACEARAPMVARRWAAECLRAQLGDGPSAPAVIDDAVLCVSELVTNAVAAGCSQLSVELRVGERDFRVVVVDDAPGDPVPRQANPGDRSGRGLRLVDAMSRRWGVDPSDGRKAVWAEFARPE